LETNLQEIKDQGILKAGEGILPAKALNEYAEIVGPQIIEELIRLGNELKGLKMQQVNSARYGGGVAEMLCSVIPLERVLGLDMNWEVITGNVDFFNYTKTIHNFLQGKMGIPDLVGTKVYWDTNKANFKLINLNADIILIHDPQPAGLIKFLDSETRKNQKWIWRCHIQLLPKDFFVTEFLRTLIESYDATIFSSTAISAAVESAVSSDFAIYRSPFRQE